MKKEEILTPETISRIRDMRASGLTLEQTAKSIGVSRKTLYTWTKENEALADALKEGAAAAVEAVESKLFELAMSGNLTACIFFLKNRSPEKWADKPRTRVQLEQERLTIQTQEMDYMKKKAGFYDKYDFLSGGEPYESEIYPDAKDGD
jgi:predicted DNA-binding protein (UPF0251 family)